MITSRSFDSPPIRRRPAEDEEQPVEVAAVVEPVAAPVVAVVVPIAPAPTKTHATAAADYVRDLIDAEKIRNAGRGGR